MVINSKPLHLLPHGGNSIDDAGTIVIAHAAFGHNQFFQEQLSVPANGQMQKAFSDYLAFAKRYLAACEERYGSLPMSRRSWIRPML